MNTVIPQGNSNNRNADNLRRSVAEGVVNYLFLRLIGYCLSLIIAIIVLVNELEVVYSLIPLICCELFSLLVLCIYQQKTKGDETLFLFIFENFMFFAFLITVIINLNVNFEKMFLMILPTFHLFVNLMSIQYQGQKLGFPVFLIDNLVFYLCFLFSILKIRKLIDVSFYVCFWPFYLFAFLYLMVMGKDFINLFVNKHYKGLKGINGMFKLSSIVIGFAFIATHILAVIFLASSKFLFNLAYDVIGFTLFDLLNSFICIVVYYMFTFVYVCFISQKIM
jgi:hypothetical protein